MKYLLPLIFFTFVNLNFYSLRAEESLTIKQQLDRIVQEVSDLNKAVFNKSFDRNDLNLTNNPDDTERFTSIDIRMHDLERDINKYQNQIEYFLCILPTDINIKYILTILQTIHGAPFKVSACATVGVS